MKSYTDIEQSKELAKILPIESADMKFPYFGDGQYGTTALFGEPIEFSGGKDVPCWSLAALFEVLPTIDDGNRNPVFCKDIRFNKWHIVYHGTAIEPTIDSGLYDNPIDACVEMIIKLHEQKLL